MIDGNYQMGCQLSKALLLPLVPWCDYEWSLVCVTLAVASSGFHNSGVFINPQDIAPLHAGSIFGEPHPPQLPLDSEEARLCTVELRAALLLTVVRFVSLPGHNCRIERLASQPNRLPSKCLARKYWNSGTRFLHGICRRIVYHFVIEVCFPLLGHY